MNQLTEYKKYKYKTDFLVSNESSSIQQTQTVTKYYKERIRCSECNKKRKPSDNSHQICYVCKRIKIRFNQEQSGNKVIDDFIRHTQINYVKEEGKMEFVPYTQFKDIEFIAEGGFSKVYKATWANGFYDCKTNARQNNYTVVLKKLNNSKNTTSKDLNELKVFYDFSLRKKSNKRYSTYIIKYFGTTQDPVTREIMIIMPYYNENLIHYITKDFFNINWESKLHTLKRIISGLASFHSTKICHRDLHSGNILLDSGNTVISDLGISKSATTESTDDHENYGIIPYMAPEIFLGQKYTEKSDIYSFGMIMWEVMVGRRPFWDRNHDTKLIIDIIDGIRPPIVTNAPGGYVGLMKKCWHSDPSQRPIAVDIHEKVNKMCNDESWKKRENLTQIIESPDIGPVRYNPGAIYKSRPLSGLIQSAVSLRSSRNQSINLEFDNLIIEDNNDSGYHTKEFDLNNNVNAKYTTREIEFDI